MPACCRSNKRGTLALALLYEFEVKLVSVCQIARWTVARDRIESVDQFEEYSHLNIKFSN